MRPLLHLRRSSGPRFKILRLDVAENNNTRDHAPPWGVGIPGLTNISVIQRRSPSSQTRSDCRLYIYNTSPMYDLAAPLLRSSATCFLGPSSRSRHHFHNARSLQSFLDTHIFYRRLHRGQSRPLLVEEQTSGPRAQHVPTWLWFLLVVFVTVVA